MPAFEMKERTRKLVAYLRDVEKGTDITYRELTRQIGERRCQVVQRRARDLAA